MATKIEWTDVSWNPVTGCTPISPGCKNCYARRVAQRLKGRYGYPKDEPFAVTVHPDRLDEPLHWRKPRRVFVCSMGDLFHEGVPFEFRCDVWLRMTQLWRHTFQILTKRPERALNANGVLWTDNIHMGVTAENQEWLDKRVDYLLQIPAAVRFVSLEPLLGPVDPTPYMGHCTRKCSCGYHRTELDTMPVEAAPPHRAYCLKCGDVMDQGPSLDWVIVGCETGPGRRPCKIEWVRDIVQQCQAAGVPVFVKKLEIDGKVTGDMILWPEDLRVREYPKGADGR